MQMKDDSSENAPSGDFFSNRLIIAIALATGLITAILDLMGDFTWQRFLLIFFFHSVIAFLAFFAILRLIRFFTDGLGSARDLREHLRKHPPDDFQKTSPDDVGPVDPDRPKTPPKNDPPRKGKD
jgi:hypothetical protein